jgi:hypothetical protein
MRELGCKVAKRLADEFASRDPPTINALVLAAAANNSRRRMPSGSADLSELVVGVDQSSGVLSRVQLSADNGFSIDQEIIIPADPFEPPTNAEPMGPDGVEVQ